MTLKVISNFKYLFYTKSAKNMFKSDFTKGIVNEFANFGLSGHFFFNKIIKNFFKYLNLKVKFKIFVI